MSEREQRAAPENPATLKEEVRVALGLSDIKKHRVWCDYRLDVMKGYFQCRPCNCPQEQLARLKAEAISRSAERLAESLKSFTVSELDWDWSCSIGHDTRRILKAEYDRRGIVPGATGRVERHGGRFL